MKHMALCKDFEKNAVRKHTIFVLSISEVVIYDVTQDGANLPLLQYANCEIQIQNSKTHTSISSTYQFSNLSVFKTQKGFTLIPFRLLPVCVYLL